ncbi:hypothetical protein [Streptomyces sp. t39]|uniref:hypothetical protein n=1 Tax=Streptomyces sp. t39 TaxID=1828156 RepID=UPI0011CDA38F|nr:hypothetical protein [Streptomyces sp. t39]TXS58119.1 hypothetical protein EAO77_00685 [Streptomyces sp. t39]
MHPRLASLCLLGPLLLAGAVPAAHAEPADDITSFAYSVSPASVAPGGTVSLTATECASATVTVTAPVFDTVTLTGGKPGRAELYEDAEPGAEYEVVFDCEGETGRTKLTVSASGGQHHSPAPRPGESTRPPAHDPGRHEKPAQDVKPDGGVKAGTGGSFTDLGPAQLAAGGVVIASGLAWAVLLLLRRRSGGRA